MDEHARPSTAANRLAVCIVSRGALDTFVVDGRRLRIREGALSDKSLQLAVPPAGSLGAEVPTPL